MRDPFGENLEQSGTHCRGDECIPHCCSTAHNVAGQVLCSSGLRLGSHTIRLVRQGGTYMLLDALTVR